MQIYFQPITKEIELGAKHLVAEIENCGGISKKLPAEAKNAPAILAKKPNSQRVVPHSANLPHQGQRIDITG